MWVFWLCSFVLFYSLELSLVEETNTSWYSWVNCKEKTNNQCLSNLRLLDRFFFVIIHHLSASSRSHLVLVEIHLIPPWSYLSVCILDRDRVKSERTVRLRTRIFNLVYVGYDQWDTNDTNGTQNKRIQTVKTKDWIFHNFHSIEIIPNLYHLKCRLVHVSYWT